MVRIHLVLSILLLALLVFLCSACSPAAADMTPTPDPSIVWSDDFEDWDIEGWEEAIPSWYVNEGALTSGPDHADPIIHESNIATGTWSFDLLYGENMGSYYSICLSCDQDFRNGFGFSTWTGENSVVFLNILSDGNLRSPAEADLGKKLSGWNHFDITRDESGNTKIYVNEELVIEYKEELTISPQIFFLDVNDLGLAFDNLVIRDQVIDIQP